MVCSVEVPVLYCYGLIVSHVKGLGRILIRAVKSLFLRLLFLSGKQTVPTKQHLNTFDQIPTLCYTEHTQFTHGLRVCFRHGRGTGGPQRDPEECGASAGERWRAPQSGGGPKGVQVRN